MALQNNIIAGPNSDINYGAYTNPGAVYEWKFTVTLADIVALGAFTSGDVILVKMPARSFLTHSYVKHSTPISGGGITAATAQVQTATGNRGGSLDVFAAASNTAYDIFANPTATLKEASIATTIPVMLHLTSTTANLGAATAGQIDVIVGYKVLPS